MPQYNRNELEKAARDRGFVRDTFEKVLRLAEILTWINSHDNLSEHLILKGGTAINLTVFSLPRLSVDIDMDFTPNMSRSDMMPERDLITKELNTYMEAEGYSLSPASRFHHSLDAFHYSFINSAGNRDMIKIELNYSLRAHLFEPVERNVVPDIFKGDETVLTLDPIEIYAAKTNALISRTAARDFYDFNSMIASRMFEGKEDLFRKSIIFYCSISQDKISTDFSTDTIDRLDFTKILRDLFPVLAYNERHKNFDLEEKKRSAKQYLKELLRPTEQEKEYIERFGMKEYRPELLFEDQTILDRISEHPMALWKCKKE